MRVVQKFDDLHSITQVKSILASESQIESKFSLAKDSLTNDVLNGNINKARVTLIIAGIFLAIKPVFADKEIPLDERVNKKTTQQRLNKIQRRLTSRITAVLINKNKKVWDKVLQTWKDNVPVEEMLREVSRELDMSYKEVKRIFRTEYVREYNKKQLDKYLGDDKIEYFTWQTAGDDKVCPYCFDMSDRKFTRAEIKKNMPPAHPYCRCTVVPYVGKYKGFERKANK